MTITRMEGGEPPVFCRDPLPLCVSGEVLGAEVRKYVFGQA